MPARRTARQADTPGIDAKLVCVLADPGDRALHVDHVVWEGRPRAQAVVDVESNPAVGGHVVEQRDALLEPATGNPAATMDLDHRRARRVVGGPNGRAIDVKAQAQPAVLVEDDAASLAHGPREEHQEREDEVASWEAALRRLAGHVFKLALDRRGAAPTLPCEPGQEEEVRRK